MRHASTRSGGRDVHQDSIAVASVAQAHAAEGRSLGPMGTRQAASDQRLRKRHSKATPLVLVDDAGPWGSWRYRDLTQNGQGCGVVAPALIPNTASDRVNTARRDARPLARLRRSGDLAPGSVPTVDDEAIRDLTRARADPMRARKTAKCRLNACLLRHDSRSTGRAAWGPAHRRGRSAVVCPPPAQQMIGQAYGRAVTEPTARLPRREQARHDQVHIWRLQPVVAALPAVRGVQCPVAVTLVAARGDLTRFDHPRPLMTSLGLLPAASASGERRRQGASPQAGHPPARRALGEGAWASRSPAKGSRPVHLRLAQLPPPRPDLRWQAQGRLCQRERHLMARGHHATPVVVAIARDLVGFVWAMAQQVP